jgi:hypothetical protein
MEAMDATEEQEGDEEETCDSAQVRFVSRICSAALIICSSLHSISACRLP